MRNALDDLIKQVKPLAALAGAAQPQAKPLADILNSIKTSSKDKDVTVSGKVTSANIGKMMKPRTRTASRLRLEWQRHGQFRRQSA